MSIFDYWELTLGQFKRCAEGYRNRLETEAKQTDQLNHILGQYISFSTHDPKQYPQNPMLTTPEKPKQSIDSFMQLAKERYGKKEEQHGSDH